MRVLQKSTLSCLLLCFTLLNSGLAFDCPDIQTESKCLQIAGCSYSQNACSGSGDFSCDSSNCYFVYPQAGEDGDGSITLPFNSIDQAISQILTMQNGVSSIILIDPEKEDGYIFFEQAHEITDVELTIKPLFKEKQELVFSLSQEYESTYFFTLKNTPMLRLQNIILKSQLVQKALIYSADSKIELIDCDFQWQLEDNILKFIKVNNSYLDIINSTIKSSYFIVEGSSKSDHSNDNPVINIENTIISDISWLRSDPPFLVSLTKMNLQLLNTTIQDMDRSDTLQHESALFQLSDGQLLVKDSLFQNMTGNMIIADQSSKTNIQNAKFRKISSATMIRLANLTDSKKSSKYHHHSMTGTTIEDINITQTAVFVSGSSFYMRENSMNKIHFIPKIVSDYFYINMQGACLYSQADNTSIYSSSFTNINATCVNYFPLGKDYLEDKNDGKRIPQLKIIKSIFSNEELKQKKQYSLTDSNSLPGISWVYIDYIEQNDDIYEEYNAPIKANISKNIFLSNKISPTFGGAIGISTIRSVSQMALRDNIVIGCKAKYGGVLQGSNEQTKIPESIKGYDIQSNIFKDTKSQIKGGAISMKTIDETKKFIKIEGNILQNCSSSVGGSLSLTQVGSEIKDNVFHANNGKFGGAIFSSGDAKIEDEENIFAMNIAKVAGGVAFLQDHTYNFCNENNILEGNSAKVNCECVKTILDVSDIEYNRYIFLVEPNVIGAFPPYSTTTQDILKNISNFGQEKLFNISNDTINIVPGNPFPGIFRVFIDEFEETYKIYDDLSVELSIDQGKVLKGQTLKFNEGSLYLSFDTVILTGDINSSAILTIKPSLATQAILPSFTAFDLKINFTTCQIGDIYIPDLKVCSHCPNGTFSFLDPFTPQGKCTSCSPDSICFGGNQKVPIPGYYSTEDGYTLKCDNPEACAGGVDKQSFTLNLNGDCNFFLTGPLCTVCSYGYATQIHQECEACSFGLYPLVAFLGKVLLSFGFVFYILLKRMHNWRDFKALLCSKDKNKIKEKQNQFDTLAIIKIIASFSQTFSILVAFKYSIDDKTKVYYYTVAGFIPLIFDGYSSQCAFQSIFGDDEKIPYYLFVTEVLFMLLLSILIYLYYSYKQRKTRNSEHPYNKWLNFRAAVSVIFYLKQPDILIQGSRLFQCREISANKFAVNKYLNLECFTPQYYLWSGFVIGSIVLIIGIIYPLMKLLTLKIFKNKYTNDKNSDDDSDENKDKVLEVEETEEQKNAHNPRLPNEYFKFYFKNTFLLGGYKDEYYYWELMIFLRKSALIVILLGLGGATNFGQSMYVLGILFGSLFINLYKKPFTNSVVSTLENYQLIALIFATFLGTYEIYSDRSVDDSGILFTAFAFFLISVTITVVFLAKSTSFFLKVSNIIQEIRHTTKRISKILESDESKKNNGDNQDENSLKRRLLEQKNESEPSDRDFKVEEKIGDDNQLL